MRRLAALLAVSGLVLAGCGDGFRNSNLNPGNWFGGSKEAPTELSEEESNPLIPQKSGILSGDDKPTDADFSVPIAQVTELRVEQIVGGAIIRAEGLASRQGAYNAVLEPATPEEEPVDGVLSYTFRVNFPSEATGPVGTERMREITVARTLSDQALEGVRVIRVSAASNARESRRR